METEKLYYQDAYLQAFTGTVRSCEAVMDAWKVVLDRTAFYPEGGGQPADHGTLGDAAVTDVQEQNGLVVHFCDRPLPVGETVRGIIDWPRRFDYMQQHSGEHILSGFLCRLYDCDNVGFHLGAETVTIDYNRDLTWEQVREAERQANEILWRDVPAVLSWPSPEELTALDYRSKKDLTGQRVRIATFPGADCCACCGTHVASAGQVGLIKVLSCQKFRQGVRLEILCGRRAMDHLSAVYGQARGAGQRLSVKPEELLPAVEHLEEELAAAKARAAELEKELWVALAAARAGEGDVLLFHAPLRADSVRRLAGTVAEAAGGLAAVFSGEGTQWLYALSQTGGAELGGFVKELNAALQGRGGGRKGFAQGSVKASREEIEAFFKKTVRS